MNVGEFIRHHPQFEFDLEEYILSTKYVDFLQQQFQRFLEARHDTNIQERCKTWILSTLRSELCHTIAAYERYADVEDLSSLLVIDKDSIRANPTGFVSSAFQPHMLLPKNTSGTTGPPVTIQYSPEFYFDLLFLTVRKIAAIAGAQDMNRSVFCIAITDNRSCHDFVLSDPTGEVGLSLQIVIDEEHPETLDRLFDLLLSLQPTCITGKPSIFEIILTHVAKSKTVPRCNPELIISSGSCLEEYLRTEMQELFQTKVINAYGMTEFGLIGCECACQNGLHIDESSFFVEVVDSQGACLPIGQAGELVLTSVTNMAMPLLRYSTGDLVELDIEPCVCGIHGQLLRRLSGRRVRCFRFASGELFSPTHFNDLFSRFPLREFQITQKSLESFEVLIELKKEYDDVQNTVIKLERHIRANLPVPVNLSVTVTTFRKESKFERYQTLI